MLRTASQGGDVLLLRGAVAGLAGTATMTAAMAGARALGLMGGAIPPRKVAGNAAEAVGLRDDLSGPAFEAGWLASHFAYGAVAGAAYTAFGRRLPPAPPVLSGSLYGVALWAIGYGGWAPALGLHRWPDEEPPRRLATEIAVHLVYGVTTAWVARRLRGPGDPGGR